MKLFGLKKLSLRIQAIELVTLYKLSRGMLVGPKIIQFSERLPHPIILNQVNSSLIKNSFFHRSFSVWNKVIKSNPPDSVVAFKRRIYVTLKAEFYRMSTFHKIIYIESRLSIWNVDFP